MKHSFRFWPKVKIQSEPGGPVMRTFCCGLVAAAFVVLAYATIHGAGM
jgi:hypothetical protein